MQLQIDAMPVSLTYCAVFRSVPTARVRLAALLGATVAAALMPSVGSAQAASATTGPAVQASGAHAAKPSRPVAVPRSNRSSARPSQQRAGGKPSDADRAGAVKRDERGPTGTGTGTGVGIGPS